MDTPFASHVQKTIDLPAYAGQTVTIRKLSGLQFQTALASPGVLVGFRAAILRAGILQWTFEPVVSPETIDDLDEHTAEFIASEIILLTKPSLKQTAEEMEAGRKNG